MEKIGEVFSFFGWRVTLWLLNRCFGVRSCIPGMLWVAGGGPDQALQPDALGISSVSRPKRNEVDSLRVDMGNPGYANCWDIGLNAMLVPQGPLRVEEYRRPVRR